MKFHKNTRFQLISSLSLIGFMVIEVEFWRLASWNNRNIAFCSILVQHFFTRHWHNLLETQSPLAIVRFYWVLQQRSNQTNKPSTQLQLNQDMGPTLK